MTRRRTGVRKTCSNHVDNKNQLCSLLYIWLPHLKNWIVIQIQIMENHVQFWFLFFIDNIFYCLQPDHIFFCNSFLRYSHIMCPINVSNNVFQRDTDLVVIRYLLHGFYPSRNININWYKISKIWSDLCNFRVSQKIRRVGVIVPNIYIYMILQ